MQVGQGFCYSSSTVRMSAGFLTNGWLPTDSTASAEALYLLTYLRSRLKWQAEAPKKGGELHKHLLLAAQQVAVQLAGIAKYQCLVKPLQLVRLPRHM